VCTCVYMCIHICLWKYMCILICLCIWIHKSRWCEKPMYTHMGTIYKARVYMCIHVYTCVYMWKYMCIHICLHRCIHKSIWFVKPMYTLMVTMYKACDYRCIHICLYICMHKSRWFVKPMYRVYKCLYMCIHIFFYMCIHISRWLVRHATVSTDAISQKSSESRNSDSTESCGTNSKWNFGLIWICIEKIEFLDLVDFTGVAFSMESIIYAHIETICKTCIYTYTHTHTHTHTHKHINMYIRTYRYDW